jgi:hypothetical protein
VLRDGLLRSKARADAEAVLAAKVYGTVLLDEATRDEPLDYFVAFSSAAAAFGNLGQTDYAFANAFLDHFAEQREQLRLQGARRGRTLAAAWPVWADGGMRIPAAAEQDMARELGMRPVRTSAGLVALERALAGTAPRLLLAPGDPARILAALDDFVPCVTVVFLHDRGNQDAVGVLVLYFLEFVDPDFEAAVGNQLDILPAVNLT